MTPFEVAAGCFPRGPVRGDGGVAGGGWSASGTSLEPSGNRPDPRCGQSWNRASQCRGHGDFDDRGYPVPGAAPSPWSGQATPRSVKDCGLEGWLRPARSPGGALCGGAREPGGRVRRPSLPHCLAPSSPSSATTSSYCRRPGRSPNALKPPAAPLAASRNRPSRLAPRETIIRMMSLRA